MREGVSSSVALKCPRSCIRGTYAAVVPAASADVDAAVPTAAAFGHLAGVGRWGRRDQEPRIDTLLLLPLTHRGRCCCLDQKLKNLKNFLRQGSGML